MPSDDPEQEYFIDWDAYGLKPGRKISYGGTLRYHQGSDPIDWGDPGAQKYIPINWFMQCGVAKDTFGARDHGAFEITFPVAFGGTPIFLANIVNTTPAFTDTHGQFPLSSAAAAEVHWWSAVNLTEIWVAWLAIGPVVF